MQSLITQMGLVVACNRHHHIEQQVCRWLLVSLDRLPRNRMTVTQELIGSMLGVRREGVTAAVGDLRRRGLIDHNRGWITVLDRPGLEKMSCECYAVVKAETERLLPYLDPHHHESA
jgi:CRP-like cAMP-binding protein